MKIFLSLMMVFALLSAGTTTAYAGGKGFNSGKNFPYIGADENSTEFVLQAILFSVVESLGLSGKDAENAAEATEANYYRYAQELAKTLSQLSPSEQNEVWQGGS